MQEVWVLTDSEGILASVHGTLDSAIQSAERDLTEFDGPQNFKYDFERKPEDDRLPRIFRVTIKGSHLSLVATRMPVHYE